MYSFYQAMSADVGMVVFAVTFTSVFILACRSELRLLFKIWMRKRLSQTRKCSNQLLSLPINRRRRNRSSDLMYVDFFFHVASSLTLQLFWSSMTTFSLVWDWTAMTPILSPHWIALFSQLNYSNTRRRLSLCERRSVQLFIDLSSRTRSVLWLDHPATILIRDDHRTIFHALSRPIWHRTMWQSGRHLQIF